jgi:hypothetical protein
MKKALFVLAAALLAISVTAIPALASMPICPPGLAC